MQLRIFRSQHLTSRCSELRVAKYKSPTVPLSSHRLPHLSNGDMRTLRLPSEIAYRTPYKTSQCTISPYQLTTPKARLTSLQYHKHCALGRHRRHVRGPLWAYSIQSLTSRRSPISRSIHAVVTRSIKYPIPDLNPASYRYRPWSRCRITTLPVAIVTTSTLAQCSGVSSSIESAVLLHRDAPLTIFIFFIIFAFIAAQSR